MVVRWVSACRALVKQGTATSEALGHSMGCRPRTRTTSCLLGPVLDLAWWGEQGWEAVEEAERGEAGLPFVDPVERGGMMWVVRRETQREEGWDGRGKL